MGVDGEVDGQGDIELVEAARAGDPIAFGRLFDRWFDRTYDVSWHIVRNPDTAAEIARDSFLAAWEQLPTLRQPGSFGGWILCITRNVSLSRLERERPSTPHDGDTVTAVLDGRTAHADIAADVADHWHDQLVWAAAAALGERDASLLDLHLRHDLGAAAIAQELEITPDDAHRLLYRLQGRLAGAIRSWVLWHDGRSRCQPLADAIDDAQVAHFGAEAVQVISAHAAGCAVCGEAQQAVLAPEALFAATPYVAAPLAPKAQAAAGLMSAGVPVGTALSRAAASGVGDGLGGAAGERTIIVKASDDDLSRDRPGDGPDDGGTASGAASAAPSRQTSSRRRSMLAAAVVALLLLLGGAVALSALPASDEDAGTTETGATADDHDASDEESQVFGADEIGDVTGNGDGDGSASPPGGSTTTTGPGGGSGGSDEPDDPGGGGGSPDTTTAPGGSSGSTTTTPGPTDPDPVPDPDPDVDPPEILRFQSVVAGTCGDQRALRSVTLIWASRGGDSTTLGPVDGAAQPVHPSGSDGPHCVLPGAVYVLTVSGPGGSDRAQLTIAV